MLRFCRYSLICICCLSLPGLTGCVKRVYEAPGLFPGNVMAVGSDMRVEVFDVDDWEVRVFRMPIKKGNRRLYQFSVLTGGVLNRTYMLDQLEDGSWVLIEKKSNGISDTKKSFDAEPSYLALKGEIIGLLKEGN